MGRKIFRSYIFYPNDSFHTHNVLHEPILHQISFLEIILMFPSV